MSLTQKAQRQAEAPIVEKTDRRPAGEPATRPPHVGTRLPRGSIDFHVHVFRIGQFGEEARRLVERSNPGLLAGRPLTEEAVPRARLEAELDAAGVATAVLLPQETPGVGIDVPTAYVLDYCRGAERLIPFASLNPLTEPDPVARLRRWAEEGARGLKLYPSYQFFYPNDPRLYPVYQQAMELGWPVVFHTGSSIFPGSRLKYALPLHLDDVAVDFPELRIVLAHAGRPAWTAEAAALARLHANVYLDIAGLPPHTLLRYLPDLPRLAEKAVFGSDWPSTPSIAQTVRGILTLALGAEQLERIFRRTATALLGLRVDSEEASG